MDHDETKNLNMADSSIITIGGLPKGLTSEGCLIKGIIGDKHLMDNDKEVGMGNQRKVTYKVYEFIAVGKKRFLGKRLPLKCLPPKKKKAYNLIDAAKESLSSNSEASAVFVQEKANPHNGLLVFRPGTKSITDIGDLPEPFNAKKARAKDSIAKVRIPWIALHKESADTMIITRNDHGK